MMGSRAFAMYLCRSAASGFCARPAPPSACLFRFQQNNRLNGIPFVPQKLRNFPAILEHRKIQTNPL